MEKEIQNIRLLIDNHLVCSYSADNGCLKENFRVTTENLIDFIKDNFVLRRRGMDKIVKINEKVQEKSN